MAGNYAAAEILNDLIGINENRAAAYEKAVADLRKDDLDIKIFFQRLADQSRYFVAELSGQMAVLQELHATDTTAQGSIYRLWLARKPAVAEPGRKLLKWCEWEEAAAQKAYADALRSQVEMDTFVRQLIATQKKILKRTLGDIKQMHNMQTVNQ